MSRLFVGNVPFRVSPEELRAEFEAVAPVNDFFWPMDRETGRKKGFCFVDVADEDMEKVIEAMHGKEVGGRELAVNEARPREEAYKIPHLGIFYCSRNFFSSSARLISRAC